MPTFYTGTGGGRLHHVYWTWPFINIRVEDDSVEFGLLWKKWILPRASIQRLRRVRAVFFTGIAFEHSHPGAPGDIVFSAPGSRPFEAALESAGYVIEGTHDWPGTA
jgi:hypothetical protein